MKLLTLKIWPTGWPGPCRLVSLSGFWGEADLSLLRLDHRMIPAASGEVRAFLVVRNEIFRLPDTLRHHRVLGVERFFIIDNGSTDGTVDFLLKQPDVHLFSTGESFAASGFGMAWINALLDEHGADRWTLLIDADEHLIYPAVEKTPLPALCARLEALGVEGMFCLLLDMYADAPLKHVHCYPNTRLLELCPYFDRGPYRMVQAAAFPHLQIYGGVRERVFGISPTISKVPLVKWKAGMRFQLSAHAVSPIRLAPITGVLLHYKFLSDFYERVKVEVERKEHFNGANEYKAYATIFAQEDNLNLLGDCSTQFRDSDQLVKLNLMSNHFKS